MLHPVPAVALATGRESSLVMHVTDTARHESCSRCTMMCNVPEWKKALGPMHNHIAHIMLASNTVSQFWCLVSQRAGREIDYEMTHNDTISAFAVLFQLPRQLIGGIALGPHRSLLAAQKEAKSR